MVSFAQTDAQGNQTAGNPFRIGRLRTRHFPLHTRKQTFSTRTHEWCNIKQKLKFTDDNRSNKIEAKPVKNTPCHLRKVATLKSEKINKHNPSPMTLNTAKHHKTVLYL